jgi:hypothetical protein
MKMLRSSGISFYRPFSAKPDKRREKTTERKLPKSPYKKKREGSSSLGKYLINIVSK